jgi:hypothetical protein
MISEARAISEPAEAASSGGWIFVFDARPFLTMAFRRVGYHGFTVLFAALVFIYGCAALNQHPR